MTNLFDSPFISCVKECLLHSRIPAQEELLSVYEDFVARLSRTEEMEESLIALFRCLRISLIELRATVRHIESCLIPDASLFFSLVGKAIEMLEMEIEIVSLRMAHYGLTGKAADPVSTLYWWKEYSVTDLMELLIALYECQALRNRDGSPASLNAIVRLAEQAFNIRIKDYRGFKRNLISRKIRFSKFLEVLSDHFISLCESHLTLR